MTHKISSCVLFFFPQSSSEQNINEVCWNGNFSLCIIRVNETCIHSQCTSFLSVKFNKNGVNVNLHEKGLKISRPAQEQELGSEIFLCDSGKHFSARFVCLVFGSEKQAPLTRAKHVEAYTSRESFPSVCCWSSLIWKPTAAPAPWIC